MFVQVSIPAILTTETQNFETRDQIFLALLVFYFSFVSAGCKWRGLLSKPDECAVCFTCNSNGQYCWHTYYRFHTNWFHGDTSESLSAFINYICIHEWVKYYQLRLAISVKIASLVFTSINLPWPLYLILKLNHVWQGKSEAEAVSLPWGAAHIHAVLRWCRGDLL